MRDTRSLLAAVSCASALLCVSNLCSALVLRTLAPKRVHNNSSKRTSKPYRARSGVSGLRATWIDEQVSLELPASREDAYFLYSSLQRQPEWSPWLKSVEYDEATGTSKWVIRSNGVKVSWRAQNTVQIPGSEVAWESTTGLGNRGRVTFVDAGSKRCLMTLTLSYNLPYVIASVLRLEAVERFVKRTLLSDLGRFKTVLAKEVAAVAAAAVADAPAAATPADVDGAVAASATTPTTAAAAAAASTPAAANASATAAATHAAVAGTDDDAAEIDAEREKNDNTASGFAGGKKLEVDRAANHSWTTDTDTDNATDTASFEAAAAEVSVGVETAVGAAAEVRNEMVAEESVEPVESGTGGVDSRSDRDINSSGSISGGGSDNSSSDAQAPGVVDNETTAVSTSTPSPLSKSIRDIGDQNPMDSSDATPAAAAAALAATAATAGADANTTATADDTASAAAATAIADDTAATANDVATATTDAIAVANTTDTIVTSADTDIAAAGVTASTDADADAAVASPAVQSPAGTSAAEGKSEEELAGGQRLGRRARIKKRLRRLFRRDERSRDRNAAIPSAAAEAPAESGAGGVGGVGGEAGAGRGDKIGTGNDDARP